MIRLESHNCIRYPYIPSIYVPDFVRYGYEFIYQIIYVSAWEEDTNMVNAIFDPFAPYSCYL